MTTPLDIYGLRTCDTCRKTRKDLDQAGVAYAFHDVRDDGVEKAQIARWAKQAGWRNLLNKASTTWRDLPDAEKERIDEDKAIALMAAHPTLMKRPIIARGDTEVYVGWSKEAKDAVL